MAFGSYSSVLDSFIPDQTERDALWSQFVAATGGTAPTDDSKLDSFVVFVGAHYTNDVNQVRYQLSPDEIQQRAILFSTFSLVLKMLKTLQTSVAVQANLLTFYGQWQHAYTNMIAKVPIYTAHADAATSITQDVHGDIPGFSNAKFVPNSWPKNAGEVDLSTLGLVYNNLNMQDIINSWAARDISDAVNGNNPAFVMTTPPFDFTRTHYITNIGVPIPHEVHFRVAMNLQIYYFSDTGSMGVSLGFKIIDTSPDQDNGLADSYVAIAIPDGQVGVPSNTPINFENTSIVQSATNVPAADRAATLSTLLKNVLNSALDSNGNVSFQIGRNNNGIFDPAADLYPGTNVDTTIKGWGISSGYAPQIPWQYDTVSPTDTAQTTLTAQKNALLQQYIQNLQAYKQVSANNAQAIQSSLDSSKEAISQQADLLNSIIQTMQTILASIFK
jgi:hypothetical protein